METTSRRFTAMSVIRAMPDNARTSTDRRRATAGRTAVRRVTPPDWLVLRDLRLRALRGDPLSFGSTYEREAAFSDGDWKRWAAEDALGDEMATFIADRQQQPIGIVGAYRDAAEPMLFHVIAMWVAPEARGEGLGRRLLSHVEAWIRSCRDRSFSSMSPPRRWRRGVSTRRLDSSLTATVASPATRADWPRSAFASGSSEA